MNDRKIAVVGAGAAGLTAAYQLKKLGYKNTTVFEKEDDVGGKVCTYSLDGKLHDIGAIWATTDYKTVHRISNDLGVPRHVANQLDMMTANGKVMSSVIHTIKENNLLRLARDAFNFWRVCRRFPRIKEPGFHEYHPDFYLTLDELSVKYKFTSLAKTMAPTMSACGYGYYEEIPALYWMKLMVLLLTFGLRGGEAVGSLKSFDNGFQSLWQEVAKGLDVRVSSPVTSMKRFGSGRGEKIEITTNGHSDIFDRVIVAAPLETAHKFMDLSKSEQELFSKIRTIRYIVTVVQCDSKAHVAFARNIRPARLGHVNAAVKAHLDSDVCVYYQIADHSTSQDQALDILRSDLAEVGIHFKNVYLQKTWNYFPHVAREDLQNGFYDQIESLQGGRGTYYAGSLLSFETVEHTAAYSRNLVDRFF